MKFEIFKFKSVTSTNEVAINLIKQNQKKIGYVSAEMQTKGRGSHGRKWISNKGNLFGSIFFCLENNFPVFNEFSIISPILISDVISYFCYKKKVNLKFPNDVFVNKKKICGVLQEVISSENKKFLIIGVGVNVVSNPNVNNKYQTTCILSETKQKPNLEEIINKIISSYEDFFNNLDSYNFNEFRKKADLMALN